MAGQNGSYRCLPTNGLQTSRKDLARRLRELHEDALEYWLGSIQASE
jgi:hypothetical protein